jgi:hypothetical protein
MKIEDKELIVAKERENFEKLRKFRKQLQMEVEEFCIENGGHDFYSWQDSTWFDVGGRCHHNKIRKCRACRKKEYKEIEVEE